ncbi:MAG: hypothetical protein D6681_21990, partial [Calditrichaeota bacterium]
SWSKLRKPMEFNHGETGFPLVGTHKIVDCVSCHVTLKFARVGSACADCHTDVHHGELGMDCQSCHTPEDWRNRQDLFAQHAQRGFPLVGVHAIADCQACHVGEQRNEFGGLPLDCSNCHQGNFLTTTNPNHTRANFSLDCQSCHEPVATSWRQTTFAHPAVFELRGAHRQTDCNSCHQATFAGTPQECAICHAKEFQATIEPPHVALGFPTECNVCHNETRWEGIQFDHLQRSGFELRGAHATAACTDCHTDNQFVGLPRDCFGCHQSDFQGAGNPDHVAGHFPSDCMLCHTETTWQPATFDHNLTQFPLTGAHQVLYCADCHVDNQYTALPTDCYSCHESDFTGVA